MSLPDTLSPTTLRQKNGSVRLLDVRTPGEFAAARIPGSHNIPLGDLEAHADALAKSDSELVVVCQSGGRAKMAAETLRAKGRTNVSVLDGGLAAWESVGGETVGGETDSGASAWTIERQVRLVAGSLVLTGIALSLKHPKAKFLSGAVGGGLTFAALSNTCMMGSMLSKLPFNRAASADIDSAIEALRR